MTGTSAKELIASEHRDMEAVLTLCHAESYLWSLIPVSHFPEEYPDVYAAIEILQKARRSITREIRVRNWGS